MNEFPYADILVLALIAIFVLLRLRNNLGKQVGFDPREKRESRDTLRRSLNAELADRLKDTANATGPLEDAELASMSSGSLRSTLEAIRLIEPGFTLASFTEGAKGAYEWVFNAFHQGDRATLRPLLSADIYADFERELAAREAAGQTSKSTLVAINSAEITEATLEKKFARINVKFESEQIQVTKDKDGAVVEGDVSKVHRVEDEWTFERELGSRSPNWTVTAT